MSMSSDAPRISVVVIVRDGERFLEEALESIVAQTTRDWEAVIVDDGSTDRTAAIAERFVERDGSRFRVVFHEGRVNRGMSASRNLGVAASRGAYVTFLDHDDVMLPGKLEAQAAHLDAEPGVGAVLGPNLRWHGWHNAAKADIVQDLGLELDRIVAPPGPLPVFLASTPSTPQAPMVRRSAIERVGGFEDAFRGMYEDQVFLAKLCLEVPIFVASEVWQKYRQHAESCVSRAHRAGSHLAARRRFLRWLRRHLERYPALAPAVRPVVDAELRRARIAGLRNLFRRPW